MKKLLLLLSIKNIEYLGEFRDSQSLEIALDNELLWVRGFNESSDNLVETKKLPTESIYYLDEDNNIFLPDKLTPIDKLKKLNWQPINEFIKAEFPKSLSPAKIENVNSYSIKIIPSDKEKKSQALLTDSDLFKNYVISALEVRLAKLIFALSENNQVLIIGDILPPLQGKTYWIKDNILLPNGFDFEIPIIAKIISEKIDNKKASYIVFDKESNYQKISKDFFAKVSRYAVRS